MRLKLVVASAISVACLVSACAAAPLPRRSWDERAAPVVEVTRDGERWTADFGFNRDVAVWAFTDSALIAGVRQPWRPQQWTVETPCVIMERRGNYDVIRSQDGGPVPRSVRFSIRPRAVDLEAEYGTLTFSDGAVAMPTRQFDVFALPSVEAADQVPGDLNGVELDGGPSTVSWRDTAGPVLFNGKRRATLTTTDQKSYVLLGRATVTPGDGLTTVMDPNLPSWIGTEIRSFAPRVGAYYQDRLGRLDRLDEAPTIMVSWNGPANAQSSMSGSVLPGLIVMKFEGRGVLNPSDEMLERSRWFIAHEAAHFWLGQGVRYQYARDAWITEGGADLMAVRALKALNPRYDARTELQSEVDDCIALSRHKAVVAAGERGEHRAYYACGAVFAMVAEGAQNRRNGGDWLDFLQPVIAANRAEGVLTRGEWTEALTKVSGDPSLAQSMDRILDQGVANPAAEIAALFSKAGVPHDYEGGQLTLR